MSETPQQYTERILSHSRGKDALQLLKATPKKLEAQLKRLDKKAWSRRPEPNRWSVGEILAHLADAELVVSWRLRLVLGSPGVPIQAFDQDVWASTFNYGRQDPKRSLETFRVLRENNLAMLKSVPKQLWDNFGMHSERGKETVAHMVKLYAGHDQNHLQQIEKIVKEKRR